MKELTLAISPCPNDTFAFHALLHGLVGGGTPRCDFADIEELNRSALAGRYDLCKVSYAIVPQIAAEYAVLDSGSALGRGNGPVFVAREGTDPADPGIRLALPGEHTTAALLLAKFFPHLRNRNFVHFSQIAPAIAAGEFDAGVLIHEGRFTYAAHGLALIADLGQLWEAASGAPLPLGAIVGRRSLGRDKLIAVQEVISGSVAYAQQHPGVSAGFVRSHAQELSGEVIQNHIDFFVNDFTLSLGAAGRIAVAGFLGMEEEKIFL